MLKLNQLNLLKYLRRRFFTYLFNYELNELYQLELVIEKNC